MSSAPELLRANAARLLGEMLQTRTSQSEESGLQVGPYQLKEPLGEGGFGTVWRAEQTEPVKRSVALKLIKPGMDTVQVLSRFEQERQILASMEHPGIASLLDAGVTAAGRPFFVMDLIKGPPINVWCQEHQPALADRLHVFVQVCQAVHHAHQKGIIHRDLKPTNILVTTMEGAPHPMVIDFGIAKAMESTTAPDGTLLTLDHQALGTPHYIAPELLSGQSVADTRSDIYSLGVILYELLTGQLPFAQAKGESSSGLRLRQLIIGKIPERPSTRFRQIRQPESSQGDLRPGPLLCIPSDLDWITMCALEKEPARRYQSVSELAEDVQRFLKSEPVLACPPSFSYVTSRLIRRHRVLFVAVGVALLSMLAATLVSFRAARVAEAARQEAEAQARRAELNEHAAQMQERRATQSGTFVTGLLDRVTAEIIRGKNPEALRIALSGSDQLLDEIRDNPELRIELLGKLADIYAKIGEPRSMLPLLKRRADDMKALMGESHEEVFASELAYLKQVAYHGVRGTVPPLVTDLRSRVEAAGLRGTRLWFDVQRSLVIAWLKLKDGPRAVVEADVALDEARAKNLSPTSRFSIEMSSVNALELAGEFDRAETLLNKVRSTHLRLNKPDRLEDLDAALLHLLRSKKDFTAAAALLRERLPAVRSKHGEHSSEMFSLLIDLSDNENDAGESALSREHAAAALAMARSTPEDRGRLFTALMALCVALDNDSDAIPLADEALAVARESGNDASVIRALDHRGRLGASTGDNHAALDCFQEKQARVMASRASTKDIVEAMTLVCSALTALDSREEAMHVAQQMWDRMLTDPALCEDKAFATNIAEHALHSYAMLRRVKPETPEPADLSAWKHSVETLKSDKVE